ncbi:hypothetical protein GGI20_000377 [Coemansia sp. BCRC 34301]|nr:hypothetical protein GGI20_000377 [Coemansia sp. BCRC 34301]
MDAGVPIQSKPARPRAAMTDDQIHPLIRSRRLDTPEDIAAWIAERKAKYPTNANARLKEDQRCGAQTIAGASNAVSCRGSKRKGSASEETAAGPANSTNPLDMLVKYVGESESSENDDDEPEVASTKPPTIRAPFKPSGLAPGEDRRKLRVCKYFAKGTCHKGNACPFSHPASLSLARQSTTDHGSDAETRPIKGNTSLLEMLMTKDIDRENYRIFQCIEYICENNFLGTPTQYELLYTGI